jgi:glycerol kinase
MQIGLLPPPQVFARQWKRKKRFVPKMIAAERALKIAGWLDCIRKLQA